MSERSNEAQEGGNSSDEVKKYILVASIDHIGLGENFFTIPPHMTVFPPFQMRVSQKPVFDSVYADIASENLPITIHTHDIEYFGDNKDVPALPVTGVFWTTFAGAYSLAKKMGLSFDDTYTYQTFERKDASRAMSFGTGDEVCTCGGDIVYQSNNPHITDFEGVIGPNETRKIHELQLFCYNGLKRVVSIYRQDGYQSVK